MFYRETNHIISNYTADRSMIPLRQDRWFLYAFLLFILFVVPQIADDYWMGAILIPLLVFSLAALGLNILTGYTGQLSLGSGGFMLLGAVATFNFLYRFDGEIIPFDMPLPMALFFAGVVTGLVGVLFGLPSIRIKGFYLIVSTLAAHFFILWFFNSYRYFVNYDHAGVVLLSSRYYEITWFQFNAENYYLPELITLNLNNYVGKYYLVLITVI
ncbi:MAG: branched-chain amino acid ABC transporter permease, partial [Gammaproteobacteria bacterium]|nr:branched-chain amino acid ABC transporter permease [Gammaproteobacteria bacterium]